MDSILGGLSFRNLENLDGCWDMSSFPTNVETRIISLNKSKVD